MRNDLGVVEGDVRGVRQAGDEELSEVVRGRGRAGRR